MSVFEEEEFSMSASPFSVGLGCPLPASVLFAMFSVLRETEGVGLEVLLPLTGIPLTTPPPVASFLGAVPTKKASKNNPPTTVKMSSPIFLLSGTVFPLCSLLNKRFHRDLTASRLFARWISFSKALVIPPPRSRAAR